MWLWLAACTPTEGTNPPIPVGATDPVTGLPTSVEPPEPSATGDTGAPEDTDPPEPELELFPEDRILEVVVEMAPDDWAALRRQERSLVDLFEGDCLAEPFPSPFTEFPGTVTIDGVTFEDVNLRKKGFLGSLNPVRPSIKVDLNDLVPGRDIDGLNKLTFNNQNQDATRIRTCATYFALDQLGVPSPRCSLAHVVVNGEDLGVYANVEDLEDGVLPLHGLDGGDFWEGTLSDFSPRYDGTFQAQSDTTDPTADVIQDIEDALAASDEDFPAAIDAVIDVDAYLEHWLGESFVGHWDGYSTNRNNFYVARPPGGKAAFLPWGVDASLGGDSAWEANHNVTPVSTDSNLSWRLHHVPETRELFLAKIDEMLTRWKPQQLRDRIDLLDALAAPHRPEDVSGDVASMHEFVRERNDVFERHREELAQPRPEPAEIWPCLHESGEVEITFDTTAGTLETGDPGSDGASTLQTPEGDFRGGAVAGLDGGTFTVNMEATKLLSFATSGFAINEFYLYDPVIHVTGSSTFGFWGWAGAFPAGIGYGVLGDGEIVFEDLGTQPGDRVRGTFHGKTYEADLIDL